MEQMQPFNFRRVRDFGEIISDTFSFLRQHFKPLLMSLLTIAGPFILLTVLLASIANNYLQHGTLSFSIQTNLDFSIMLKSYALSIMLWSINMSLLFSVLYSYILLAIGRTTPPEQDEVRAAFREQFGGVFLTALVYTILVTLGTVLLAIPGIYLFVALSPIVMIRMVERVSPPEAVRRALHLISGHWWETCGLLVVFIIIVFILTLPMGIPLAIILMILALGKDTMAWNIPVIALTVITSFISTFLYAVPMIGIALQYFNLVERRESAGMMERIEQMNINNQNNPPL